MYAASPVNRGEHRHGMVLRRTEVAVCPSAKLGEDPEEEPRPQRPKRNRARKVQDNPGEIRSQKTGIEARMCRKDKACGCSKCGKTFNQKNNLSRHLRTHIGEHPYKCSECWRSFSDHSNLISQQKLHQGEKPYECLDCRKCFSQNTSLLRQNLTMHQSIHTGERPYSCQDCSKRFRRSSDLIQHESLHTGERPYKCPDCGKGFTRSSKLMQHQPPTQGKPPTGAQCAASTTRPTKGLSREGRNLEEKTPILSKGRLPSEAVVSELFCWVSCNGNFSFSASSPLWTH
uniref:C2H2-type domain-containing protein n=1 Tax=Anser brachyrhynchus TaxID=132585 RepID=A0A8B9CTU5_9AVES